MGRKRGFDRELVMDEALKEFWRNGYDRTSLDDLLECMGINNSSFYQAFISKEKLFTELLARYRATFGRERIALLNDETRTARESLTDYFHHTIYEHPRRGFPVGCFMTNTVSSLTDPDTTIGLLALESFRNIERNFEGLLTRGEAAGESTGALVPAQGAKLVLTFLAGMAAISRTKRLKKELMGNAQNLIDLLLKKV